jgi:Tfp pilus assembly protein PilF
MFSDTRTLRPVRFLSLGTLETHMLQGSYSPTGFNVVASSALEMIVGTQAAGAGHVGAAVQQANSTLHGDIVRMSSQMLASNDALRATNAAGFETLKTQLAKGTASVQTLGALNLATQAVGFALVVKKLHDVGGKIEALRSDAAAQAERLAQLQQRANASLERLETSLERSLATQERILETLATSRTVEARQLIQQGWNNLRFGYRDEALSRFQKSLEYDNTVYLSHAALADLHREKKELAAARDHYERATKFAHNLAPSIRAGAHMQFATFLDENSEPAEALAQVQSAMTCDPTPERHFYFAELCAAAGLTSRSLHALRDAIHTDHDFFIAAMASARLLKLGPDLTKCLVSMDELLRRPLIDRMSAVQDGLRSARDLMSKANTRSLELPNTRPSDEVDEVTREIDVTLSVVATAKYNELASADRRVSELETRALAAYASVVSWLTAPLVAAREELESLAEEAPDATQPHVRTGSRPGYGFPIVLGLVGLLLLAAGVGVAFLIGAAIYAFRKGQAIAKYDDENKDKVSPQEFATRASQWREIVADAAPLTERCNAVHSALTEFVSVSRPPRTTNPLWQSIDATLGSQPPMLSLPEWAKDSTRR